MSPSGRQDTQQNRNPRKSVKPSEAGYLLATCSLFSAHRTAKNINSYGSNNFLLLVAYILKQQTYSDHHILVSSCNVALRMSNIFAYFAKILLHDKSIFPPQNVLFPNLQQIKILHRDRFNLDDHFLHDTPVKVQLYNKVPLNI